MASEQKFEDSGHDDGNILDGLEDKHIYMELSDSKASEDSDNETDVHTDLHTNEGFPKIFGPQEDGVIDTE